MRPHLAIFYRSFKELGYNHIGLGVNSSIGGRVLKRHGIITDVHGAKNGEHIARILRKSTTITHVMIEAPWLLTDEIYALLQEFPRIEFAMRVHSQFGFLQVEAGAVRLLREQLHVQQLTSNFRVSGNSRRFCESVRRAYGIDCMYLPNLYDCEHVHRRYRPPHTGRLLKLASFGAIRILKLHTTAAVAALITARERGCDLEFHINQGREENGKGVIQAIENLFQGLCWAKMIQVPWAPWPGFRTTIASMDACIQVSATETFNLVTADAACEGVPSAVSDCIEWVPDNWKTSPDDPCAIAQTLNCLLSNPHAGAQGVAALEQYVSDGVPHWIRWLTVPCDPV